MYIFEIAVAAVSIIIWGIALSMTFGITYPSSVDFMAGGGSFPFVISSILIILNFIWIIDSLQNLKAQKRLGVEAKKKLSLLTFLFGTKEQSKRLLIIMLLSVSYVYALIPLAAKVNRTFGFPVATFIFLMISIKLFGKVKWIKTTIISAATSIIIFVSMYYIFGLPMPK